VVGCCEHGNKLLGTIKSRLAFGVLRLTRLHGVEVAHVMIVNTLSLVNACY
jgi:hypothetical protein